MIDLSSGPKTNNATTAKLPLTPSGTKTKPCCSSSSGLQPELLLDLNQSILGESSGQGPFLLKPTSDISELDQFLCNSAAVSKPQQQLCENKGNFNEGDKGVDNDGNEDDDDQDVKQLLLTDSPSTSQQALKDGDELLQPQQGELNSWLAIDLYLQDNL